MAALAGLASWLPSPFGEVRQVQAGGKRLPGEPALRLVLERACANCHSNETTWPWYSHVAPASWLLEQDVSEGRKFLNFSRWPDYGPEGQSQLSAVASSQVQAGAMPPTRYLALHPEARLSQAEKDQLVAWFNRQSNQVPPARKRNSGKGIQRKENHMKRSVLFGLFIAAAAVIGLRFTQTSAQAAGGPVYTADGQLKPPTGYRKWVFIGAPLTPNGLNGGKAGFPEFHNVYVEDKNLTAYQKTGEFPEGTVIVKELLLLRKGNHPDGSADTASGRGFGEGEFNGMDVTVKESQRYANTNKWGFYNFGHHALPYEATAKLASKQECAACHIAGAAKTDMTWVDFYPVLRGKN